LPQDHDAAIPSPALKARAAVPALPIGAGIMPILLARRSLELALDALVKRKFEQGWLASRMTGSLPKPTSPRVSHGRCLGA
jgi:hypothetical protein